MKTDALRDYVIIILLAAACVGSLLLFLRTCNNPSGSSVVIRDTIFSIEKVYYRDTIVEPKPYYIVKHDIDTIIDTVEVLIDYNTEKGYSFSFDSTFYHLDINTVIFNNAVKTLNYALKLDIPTTTITETIIKKEVFSLSLGAGIGWSVKRAMPLLPLGVQVTVDRHNIGVSYELFNKSIIADYKYKILTIKN